MWNERNIGDLNGKFYIVTGGNTGLGFMTARYLLRAGAEVLFTARDPVRGQNALKRLREECGSRVAMRELNLGSLASVSKFTKEILADRLEIDALILNAGVALLPYKKTADGLETHFAVNHLGHFALTLPLIPKTDRVVVTTSGAANEATTPLQFDKLAVRDHGADYDAMQAYAESKLANVLFARGLKNRCADLEVVTTHPGFVLTELQRHSLKFRILGRFLGHPIEAGALNNVRSAVDPSVGDLRASQWVGPHKGIKGDPVVNEGVCAYANDKAAQDKLWELSESLSGVTLLYP